MGSEIKGDFFSVSFMIPSILVKNYPPFRAILIAMAKQQYFLEQFRHRLSHVESLPQLVILGLLSGIATGLLMVLFQLAVEIPHYLILPSGISDDFESLPNHWRFGLPIIGSLIIWLILFRLRPVSRKVGIAHVLERLRFQQGLLPLRNLLVQFFAGATALISGHSVGREGPAVHLGAACSSLLGQWLYLPNNSIRTLIGCGSAAAISAAFHTPLAGVIFAMEVILLEYRVVGFIPVIIAAVSANLVMQLCLGTETAFLVPALEIESLPEMALVALLGFAVGLLAAGFNHLMKQTLKFSHLPLASRLLFAGVLTGGVAIFFPQVMGLGYDTVSTALNGALELELLAILLVAKLVITPVILGLGVPAGLIGPTLFIGAIAGALFAGISGLALSNLSQPGAYAMLGMAAMMAAVLNAPLAALIALLELTSNTNIILPGMVAIVTANLTVRHLFGLPSIFVSSLQAQGLNYREEPVSQALSRAAVASIMERELHYCDRLLPLAEAYQQQHQLWLIFEHQQNYYIVSGADLKAFLNRTHEHDVSTIDLLEMPAMHQQVMPISIRATLKEAQDRLDQDELDTLCVVDQRNVICGLISRQQLENYYLERDHS